MSEPRSEPRRIEIIEQAGSPTVRFIIDNHTFILPYAYFVKAECHVRNEKRFLVVAYWSSAKITILGRQLDQLVQWLGEFRLVSVHFRTAVQASAQDDQPEIEQILVEAGDESSKRGKSNRKKPKIISQSFGAP